MLPDKMNLHDKKNKWDDADIFHGGDFHYVHTYLHKNYRHRLHSHGFYEMNIITRGSGRHYIGDTYVSANVGDVFVIPPDTNHGYYAEEPIDILHILFRREFIDRYGEELDRVSGYGLLFDIEPYIRYTTSGRCNLTLDYAELKTMIRSANDIYDTVEKGHYVHANAIGMELICNLAYMMDSEIKRSTSHDDTYYEVMVAMDYIRNNLDRKITLDSICREVNVSKATLNRHFRSVLGMSPIDYVTSCRVDMADRLLSQGRYSRTEIAQMCGFYDLSHMNKYIQKPI